MRIHWPTLVVLGGLVLQPAFAEPRGQPEARREQRKPSAESHLSSNEAARIAQKEYGGGRVLSVDQTDEGYRVKLLQKGNVRIVLIPSE